MNFILHFRGWLHQVARDERLTPHHISLYVALFESWNANHFQNPVTIYRSEMMRLSKIGSLTTYLKCLRELSAWQYIRYTASHNPQQGSKVHLYRMDTTTDTTTGTIKQAARPERSFHFKPCREVSFEFIQDGYEVIHRYSKLSFSAHKPVAYCFDDLGAEQAFKYYGNECNVMAEIILSRYDCYVGSDMITHLTTNLSATEIETMYGPRVRSRMREMFNLVAFERSEDKRV
jgi:hypothetical protein